MKFSEKLRKYRLLRQITQKELGKRALEGKRDSAVRINKYENGIIEPAPESMQILADALDVDVEALSSVDIAGDEDRIQALFDLEENRDLKIRRSEGKITLEFDTSKFTNDNSRWLSFLNYWYNERTKFKNPDENTDEYELWKARFFSNFRNSVDEQRRTLEEAYKDDLSKRKGDHYKNTSDITVLLRRMIESGLTVSTRQKTNAIGFTFSIKELTEAIKPEQREYFLTFLYEYYYWGEYGARIEDCIELADRDYRITYYVYVPTFVVIKSQVDEFIEFNNHPEKSSYDEEEFESLFADSLKYHTNEIENEIMLYSSFKKQPF
jgi:transcriptional regulator with XRE-family HTH domain